MTPRPMLRRHLRPRLRLPPLLEVCAKFSYLALFAAGNVLYSRDELLKLVFAGMASDLRTISCGIVHYVSQVEGE